MKPPELIKQDEYYTPDYAVTPILEYIPKNKTVWCPFDTIESNYVKILKENGYNVVFSHIDDGSCFFETFKECDYIISNPPYSKKNEVLKRLFELKKPFAMLLGATELWGTEKRFKMFSENNIEIMFFDKRVCFLKNYNDKPKGSSPFSSVYLCSGILPEKIIFHRIKK